MEMQASARRQRAGEKTVSAGKRYPLNMRTTRELRERIEAAATASGRSLVQEVEYRLERSFWADDVRQTIREELPRVGEYYADYFDLDRSAITQRIPAIEALMVMSKPKGKGKGGRC